MWSGCGGTTSSTFFFCTSSGALRESLASARPETMKSRTASPTCGAASATPYTSLERSVRISLMRLWMDLLLISEIGIACATRRSAGFFGAGKMVFIPRTIAKSVEYCHATHRNTSEAHTREDAHNGARRAHSLLLRETQQEPHWRRPASDRHGAHGQDAGANPDERSLLYKERLRRLAELFEEILVSIKPGKI